MKGAILVVNAGSSSLKFQVFTIEDSTLVRHVRGQMDGVGVRPHLRATDSDGATILDRAYALEEIPDLPHAISETATWLRTLEGLQLRAIGHRVVHGGPDFTAPVLIDETVLERLAEYQDLAPLHQPNNLAPIRLAMQINHEVPQVACFDTAFHRDHPAAADHYAIPRAYYDEGVRRYGFHGLSYEYISERLHEISTEAAAGRVIVAHLGSGASMCALKAGRSVESTMGFTAMDGLPMGTRPGQVDPGVVLYLISQRGMSAEQVTDLFYRGAGLKGLSGISSDMRELLSSGAPEAAFAIDHFAYRCGLNAGMLAAALGGVDAFVFTAGIGENSAAIRTRIAATLGWLGVELNPLANEAGTILISAPTSRVTVYVIPTDEELMIARHTLALIEPQGALK